MDLVEVVPVGRYRLRLLYDNGVRGVVDVSSYAGKGVFTAWKRPGVFEKVKLAREGYPCWPGGIDLCPHALYLQLTGKQPEELFTTLKGTRSYA